MNTGTCSYAGESLHVWIQSPPRRSAVNFRGKKQTNDWQYVGKRVDGVNVSLFNRHVNTDLVQRLLLSYFKSHNTAPFCPQGRGCSGGAPSQAQGHHTKKERSHCNYKRVLGVTRGVTAGHLPSPSVYMNPSKVIREGILASECTNAQHFSFEARTPLTSGVIDLLSSRRGVTQGSAEPTPGECFLTR